jgi:5-methyltetrahydropteroyltriglutamate--homocysteine methyltransferase
MTQSHILGFPRIGAKRELKKGVEAYWRGEINQQGLEKIGQQIKEYNRKIQHDAGLDFVTVGDFSWYDHVLDTSTLLGVVPERFGAAQKNVDINTYFCMARGQAPQTKETTACEMTKWFNTNYHYIVPEFTVGQKFHLASDKLFTEIDAAIKLGYRVKPVILGPLTYLWLGKTKGLGFDKLDLLPKLIPVYNEILTQLKQRKIEWVQIDEPILVLDLPKPWQNAYIKTYPSLDFGNINCLLATYFGALGDNLTVVNQLPVQGLHIDLCSNPEQLPHVLQNVAPDKIVSVGVVNGRNIWHTNLEKTLTTIETAKAQLGKNLWIGSSCSLLHSPVDLEHETELDDELKSWLAFAKQKTTEIALLAKIDTQGKQAFSKQLQANKLAVESRAHSPRVHNAVVQDRTQLVNESYAERTSNYETRIPLQRLASRLPLFPTTSIGSFPQTKEIRVIRREYKAGKLDEKTYTDKIRQEIAAVISQQEALDIDVLVHGEAERNDMVEYFGELLNGFAFTSNGWVQSYGSRCVKPPIIYGDVSRQRAMTVSWSKYAQSLTNRPVKGMLTGPVTILAWSFVRDDLAHSASALQIALALRDEVHDLEQAGIHIIQIDEPAFRESLPLRKADWQHYLDWAVFCFRVSSSGVKDETQIHTHMCYSEFNDVIEAIADLDADVITIESSRSEMELLKAFESFEYPNEIGPGVYDIHSPRVPTEQEIIDNLEKAAQYIPATRLWVNPDCGLKTRDWPEVKKALVNMVAAAKFLRNKYSESGIDCNVAKIGIGEERRTSNV